MLLSLEYSSAQDTRSDDWAKPDKQSPNAGPGSPFRRGQRFDARHIYYRFDTWPIPVSSHSSACTNPAHNCRLQCELYQKIWHANPWDMINPKSKHTNSKPALKRVKNGRVTKPATKTPIFLPQSLTNTQPLSIFTTMAIKRTTFANSHSKACQNPSRDCRYHSIRNKCEPCKKAWIAGPQLSKKMQIRASKQVRSTEEGLD
ncbi:hypothetical protein Q9189_004253 [Teloschistes chrysophthalmus]